MTAPILLADQDGVISGFEEGFYRKWKLRQPTAPAIRPQDRTTFYVSEELGEIWRPQARALIAEEGFFAELPPVPGAADALNGMLAAGIDVRICTAPPLTWAPHAASDKLSWIREHLGEDWVHRTVITFDKTIVYGEVLIDDKPAITGVRTPSWTHVVFDAPYNQGSVDRPRLRGWSNWRDTVLPLLNLPAAA